MKKHQEAYDKMMSLRGAEFDRAYMRHQVKDHEEDVAEFNKESKSAQDADVKACAAKMLPTLKEHLEMARKVAAKTNSLDKPFPGDKPSGRTPPPR